MMYACALVDSFEFAAGWECISFTSICDGEADEYRFTNRKVTVVIEVDLLDGPAHAKIVKVHPVIQDNQEDYSTDQGDTNNYYLDEDDMPF